MAIHEPVPFAQLLSRYRLASGLTQEELAERAGVSARGVSDLERGVSTRPRAYTVYQLAEALNLVPRDRALFEAAAYQWSVLPGDHPRGEHTQATGSFLGALPPGPLAAREEEMQRIRQLLETASGGAGRLLLLSGAHGVGKTRLAQEIMVEAKQIGFLVLTGRCYGTGEEDPLAPVWHALSALERHESRATNADLVRCWQEILQLAKFSVGPRLFQAMSEIITLQAAIGPLALLLDDMQHAAPATVQLMDHLARSTRDAPVFLLVTYREEQLVEENPGLAREVQELTRERLAERIMVRRFIPEETAAFAANLMREEEVSEEFADFLHRRSKGNPRYIEELVRSLGGRLELEGEIGAGAMGRVFAAYDRKTDREVAAKLMLARGEVSLETPHRFQQEGAMLAKLSHPNIVQIYDTFIEEHASCIIMERVDGRSLRQVLEDGPLSLPRVKHLAQQVVAALDHAHHMQIVHRDVKPDNIMVTGDDQVKVTDFGIARILKPDITLETIATTGMRMGTPLYMAPEQIQDKRIDGRTDIYAVGAVLFQMVTGRPPFEGSDALAIAIKHLQEEPPSPSSINSVIPKDWDALILKAMAKEPGKRFQSARELEQAIRALSVQANTGTETISLRRQPAVIRRFAGPIPAVLVVVMAVRRVPLLGPIMAAALIAVVAALAMHSFTSPQSLTTVGRNVPRWGFPGFVSPSLLAPSGIAVSAQGNVYVVDTLNNRVVELSASGLPIAQWGSPGSGPGQLAGPKGVAIDTQGNVYVADTGNSRVQEFSPQGTWLAQWFKRPGNRQLFDPLSLAADGRGNVFVVAAVDGFSPSNIFKLGPGGHTQKQYWGLGDPGGVAVDTTHGAVYFVDSTLNTIIKLTTDGALLATWHAGLSHASDIALDSLGNIYVADTGNNRIVKLSATGQMLASWRDNGSGSVGFRSPEALAVDAQGNVYVADTGNSRTVKLSSTGIVSGEWNNQPPAPIVSLRLTNLTVDPHDNVWAVDQDHSRIYELSPSGKPLVTFDMSIHPEWRVGYGLSVDKGGRVSVLARLLDEWDLTGLSSRFVIAQFSSRGAFLTQWGSVGVGPGALSSPTGLASDRQGNVYEADSGNYRVQKFSPTGEWIHQWGTNGNGPGQFEWPVGVAVDQHGNVWAVDSASNRVEEFSPSGKLLSMWGKQGSAPGEFRGPMGIAVDARGDVYVADTGNNRIQKLAPDGRPLAESGTKGFDPGEFLVPYNVSVDSHGNVYVLDLHGIHKLASSR